MNELQRRYMETIKLLAGLLVAVALLVNALLKGSPKLQEYVTSGTSLFYLLGEWLIRKHLWKITDPRLVLEGEWEGVTVFEACESGSAWSDVPLPPSVAYRVLFEQDCLNLKIAPTHADKFVTWASDALQMDGDGNIIFAYHVRYSGGPFPPDATGVERLDVVDRDSRGRPILMQGSFAQCARGAYPVYRGRVEYRRSKTRPAIAKGTSTPETT